jgi:hypothetical protein
MGCGFLGRRALDTRGGVLGGEVVAGAELGDGGLGHDGRAAGVGIVLLVACGGAFVGIC